MIRKLALVTVLASSVACQALFGVDFDDARARDSADAAVMETVPTDADKAAPAPGAPSAIACDGGGCDASPAAAACDKVSCPTGCCAAGVCQAGDRRSACGAGGSECKVCNDVDGTLIETCHAHACQTVVFASACANKTSITMSCNELCARVSSVCVEAYANNSVGQVAATPACDEKTGTPLRLVATCAETVTLAVNQTLECGCLEP